MPQSHERLIERADQGRDANRGIVTQMSEGQRHIVLIHRYFWPDSPPYAAILREISKRLALDGHEVTVLTSQPSYGSTAAHDKAPGREVLDGANVRRLPLLAERKDQRLRRIVNLGAFSAQVFWRILRMKKPTAIMAATTPPMFVAMAASWAARIRGAAFVYHNQDIYPEVLGEAKGRVKKVAFGAARRLDSSTGLRAARTVVLSEDMSAAWQERGLEAGRVRIINNFDTSSPGDEPQVDLPASGKRRLVFAGNIGNFQDVPGLIRAVNECSNDALELVVVGDGVEFERCKELAGPRVSLVGRTSPAEAKAWIASGHGAVISLHGGLYRYVYPSKTLTYLHSGVPLFARIEPDSELGRMITTKDLGWVADPADWSALVRALDSFAASDEVTLKDMSANALLVGEDFSMQAMLNAWSEMFAEIVSPSS